MDRMKTEEKPRPKCITPGCDHISHYRGLCNGCYQSALAIINTGQTTWLELESLGLADPGRKRTAANRLRDAWIEAKRRKSMETGEPNETTP